MSMKLSSSIIVHIHPSKPYRKCFQFQMSLFLAQTASHLCNQEIWIYLLLLLWRSFCMFHVLVQKRIPNHPHHLAEVSGLVAKICSADQLVLLWERFVINSFGFIILFASSMKRAVIFLGSLIAIWCKNSVHKVNVVVASHNISVDMMIANTRKIFWNLRSTQFWCLKLCRNSDHFHPYKSVGQLHRKRINPLS